MGNDEFAANMEKVAGAEGLVTRYLRAPSAKTGTCAVLVVDGERSLVANLGAAEHYDLAHTEANWAAVEAARVFYISSFFMTHSHAVIMRVAKVRPSATHPLSRPSHPPLASTPPPPRSAS